MSRIYLDHAATTPLRPEAAAAMAALGAAADYNPSSLHAEGRAARAALDDARALVARTLGVAPREIVFTAGGSESDGLAILGAARAGAARGRHVVSSAIEHHAVLHALDALEAEGCTVTRLGVRADGTVDPERFAAALRPDTVLASIMLANNEIGTLQPIAALCAAAHANGTLFHTDAVQAPGNLALDVAALGVDLLSLSAHKFGGPKGTGVLYVRSGTALAPQILGGGQEHGLRAGTENVAGITGLAAALALAVAEQPVTLPRLAALRDRLESSIVAAVPDARINAAGAARLPNVSSVGFAGVAADLLLMRLDLEGVAASAGSACAAGALERSHVVAALRVPDAYAGGVIRFSLGRITTAAEVDRVAALLPRLVEAVRAPAGAV